MNFSSNPEATRSRWWGFAAVLCLHVVVGWALTQGLATQVVQFVKPPVQVALIAQAPPPPPPPPPPMPVVPKSAPSQKVVAAPPPPAAPPVVQAAATELPSPMAITPTPPAPPPLPEPPVVVSAAPAVVAPPARMVQQEIGLVCPHQVKPIMPRRALQEGVGGFVKVMATVRGGKVVAVEVLSARPRGVFEGTVRQAMMQYRCESPPDVEVKVPQEFNFTVVEE
ncbi:MAG: energy transducer TonB [Burkholderiales bacterium]